MGSCGTKIQREEIYTAPRIPSISIADYEPTLRETPLQPSIRELSVERTNSIPEPSEPYEMKTFKFQSRDRILLRQQFNDNTLCSSISLCRSVKRIILLFKYYHFLETNFEINECNNKLLKYFHTKYKHLINDYHHIINHHLINNIQYQLLYNEISKYISCDITQCAHFARNNGCWVYNPHIIEGLTHQQIEGIEMDSIPELSFYLDILDSIHCYFLHSYDSGFRMHLNEMEEGNIDRYDTTDDVSKLFKDEDMNQLKWYIYNKTKAIQRIIADRMQFNKFHTNYPDHRVVKCTLQSIVEGRSTDQVNGDISASQMNQYCDFCSDHRFYYWDYYKDLNSNDHDCNTGYTYCEWYIHRKYNDVKDELLNNEIYCIDYIDYQEVMYKAMKLFELSNVIRSMIYTVNIDTLHYEINDRSTVDICNILCVILYTDYSLLSYHLRSTFRRINAAETRQQLKARNSEFWFLSRILRETVECYGSVIGDTQTNKYYTSISFVLFSSFSLRFVGITSMTTEISVITNYCIHDNHNKKGIVLELKSDEPLRCFDCSVLSRFGNENEQIFFGGNGELSCSSIKVIANNSDYGCFLKAIEMFMDAMNGKLLFTEIRKYDYQIINDLCIGNTNCFPHYINEMFINLCEKKMEVRFDLYNYKWNMFLDEECHNLVLFDDICLLFPKCKYITIDSVGQISIDYFSQLLQIIQNINNKIIKKIEIRNVEMDYKQYELNNIESMFNDINWIIEVDKTDLVLTKQRYYHILV